jgi:hypothetical protein
MKRELSILLVIALMLALTFAPAIAYLYPFGAIVTDLIADGGSPDTAICPCFTLVELCFEYEECENEVGNCYFNYYDGTLPDPEWQIYEIGLYGTYTPYVHAYWDLYSIQQDVFVCREVKRDYNYIGSDVLTNDQIQSCINIMRSYAACY